VRGDAGVGGEALAFLEYRNAEGTRWAAGQGGTAEDAILSAVIRAANNDPIAVR